MDSTSSLSQPLVMPASSSVSAASVEPESAVQLRKVNRIPDDQQMLPSTNKLYAQGKKAVKNVVGLLCGILLLVIGIAIAVWYVAGRVAIPLGSSEAPAPFTWTQSGSEGGDSRGNNIANVGFIFQVTQAGEVASFNKTTGVQVAGTAAAGNSANPISTLKFDENGSLTAYDDSGNIIDSTPSLTGNGPWVLFIDVTGEVYIKSRAKPGGTINPLAWSGKTSST